jgi:hypothetical protein
MDHGISSVTIRDTSAPLAGQGTGDIPVGVGKYDAASTKFTAEL